MKRKKNTGSSIMDRIKPVKELPLIITALFYGRTGTGKTTVLGTFPKPLLIIDIGEKGTDSVVHLEGVDAITINEWQELEDIYWKLKGGEGGYKTIGIDAVHSLQNLAIEEAKNKVKKNTEEQTSKRDFGIASGLLQSWIFNYRDLQELGINIVFLAHDRLTTVEDDNEDDMLTPEVGPRIMPSVASALMGAVNVVGHTFIREVLIKSKKAGVRPQRKVDYCLRVGPHGYYATKIRNSKNQITPDFIIDPDYEKLVEVIRPKIKRKKVN